MTEDLNGEDGDHDEMIPMTERMIGMMRMTIIMRTMMDDLHSGFEHLLGREENLVWLVAIAVNIPGIITIIIIIIIIISHYHPSLILHNRHHHHHDDNCHM